MAGFHVRPLKGNPFWAISVPYWSTKLNAAARAIPGTRWDSKIKAHVGYPDAIALVVEQLRAAGLNSDDPPERGDFSHMLPVSYAEARDYQKTGIDFLISRASSGALLADEMGLGKGFQTIKAVRALRRKTVIVCPAHVRGVWERDKTLDDKGGEFAKWWPEAALFKPYGLKPSTVPADADVVIIHYDIIHAWVPVLLEWAKGGLTIAFDEAHVLLNAASKRSKACRLLANAAAGRIALTGTPPTDRVKDLFNIADTISPGRFGDFFPYGVRYCCPPEAPIWMADSTFKPIGDVRVGDEIMGWEWGRRGAEPPGKQDTSGRGNRNFASMNRGSKRRKLASARVVSVSRRFAEIVKVTFESGRTLRCTADHRWLSGRVVSNKQPWTRAMVGHCLAHVIDVPRELSREERDAAAWLGGMFDGEGNISGSNVQISQSRTHNPEVCARIESTLTRLGFDWRAYEDKNCSRYSISGRQQLTNFLNWCAPARKAKIENCVRRAKIKRPDRIVSIEHDGLGDVVALTTSTGNYIVWGFASKNCNAHKVDVPAPGGMNRTVWDFDGRSNIAELRGRLDWFTLRRTKREVMTELPALTRQIVDVDVPATGRIGLSAALVGDKKKMRAALDSAADVKLKQVIALIRGHLEDGQRVVVGTYRRAVCEQICDTFKGSVPVEFIHGGVPLPNRNKKIDRLRRVEGPCALVVNIDCASTGIDLTFASVAVMAELVWEPRDLIQFEARLHRYGQQNHVLVQYVIARGTGDELILFGVVSKLDNFTDLVENDDGDGMKDDFNKKDEGLSRLAAALKKMGQDNGKKKKEKRHD